GEWEMRNIYIPVSTAQKVYSKSERLHQIMLTGKDLNVGEMKMMEEEIRAVLASRLEFDPEDRQALWVNNLSEEYQNMQNLFFMIRLFMWFVGIGSIIAGVIGVSNIMLIVVKDRTKEIGIRKALGATPQSIVSMILQESLFITAVAGYLGMFVGVGLIALAGGLVTEFFREPEVYFGVVVFATIILVIAGGLAGYLPARQAAKINPVIAMKAD
ncbi:MAG: FtsX-like permease family protein, partial [Bacteroidota bacterium]